MGSTAAAVASTDGDSISTTIWTLVWAFTTLVWSIFTPPHRTFPARLLIFQPLWGVRMYLNDSTWVQDLGLFLGLHSVFSYITGAWRFINSSDLWWLDVNNHDFMIYLKVFSLLGICGIMAGGIVHRGQRLKSESGPQRFVEQSIDEQLLPPLLIPSRTTHSRVFPQKHAFSYSYLFVGIPIGLRGRVSNALSIDSPQRSWFDVRSEDYLIRGNRELGLAEKLKRYLHTQGVTDRDYSFAYLVTAPRFLSYSFNPVSFWYLYDSEIVLKYMILEVNNTFDERRMYLLRADDSKQDSDMTFGNGHDKQPWESRAVYFTGTFDKDFHVSPFNSRKGSYSLRSVDPLAAYQQTGQVKIDNNIVLRSSKESPKLVARVWSEGFPRDAGAISNFDLMRFIACWWWVGLITFPRIVWEASKLFFRKKLHVWYRPEVTGTSIGRDYTDDEKHLESFFHAFLERVVQEISTPFRLVYEPTHAGGEQMVFYSPVFTYEEEHRRTMILRVVSPAFYSRFVHYAHAKEAFDRECLATDEKNQTVNIQNANLLPILLDAMQKLRRQTTPRKRSVLSRLRWSILSRVRCPPPEASFPSKSSDDYNITDIRSFCDSELDVFVKQRRKGSGVYRRIVTKLFLAQRFALGIPALITGFDWLLRATMLLITMYACNKTHVGDVLRPTYELGLVEMITTAGLVGLANAVHVWSFLKG